MHTEIVTATPEDSGKFSKSHNYTFSDIPVFNPDLGDLMKIEFKLTLDAAPFVDVYNHDKTKELFSNTSATDYGSLRLRIPTTTGTRFLDLCTGHESTRGTPMGPPAEGWLNGRCPSGDSAQIFGPTYSKDGDLTIFNPTSMYSGSCDETYDLAASFIVDPASHRGRANDGVSFCAGEDLWACLSVEYFYCGDVAAPEPSTLALVVLSLCALVFGRRFVVKRAQSC